MKRVLVTGATGFVGRSLVPFLAKQEGWRVRAVSRKPMSDCVENVEQMSGLDVGASTDWTQALTGVDVVVHCAARVHVMNETAADPAALYREINVDGTLNLARQALACGVKRFVFLSSVKVHGEQTEPGLPFYAAQVPAPSDDCARSKLEAEQALQALALEGDMEVVVVRSSLVYGAGVKANFRSMMAWTAKGLPLPLGAIRNARSMVSLDNLVDLIMTCLTHPAAANQTFLVSDGEDLSTSDLLRRMAGALNRPSRLLPFPACSLVLAASMLGKKSVAQRLCGNLQVDVSHTRETLGWEPPVSVDEALQHTADAYLAEQAGSPHIRQPRILRVFDVLFALLGLSVGLPLLMLLLVLGYFDTGSPLFRQQRVGRNKQPFTLVKFRTMKVGTASVASHLADNAAITPLGNFMRKTKLDELPQLWNVLKGEMSLVGPRPGLFNQEELTRAREDQGVFAARPGITGLAQVNNIDMSTPELLAQTDRRMLVGLSISAYFKYILQTVTGKGSGDAVSKS